MVYCSYDDKSYGTKHWGVNLIHYMYYHGLAEPKPFRLEFLDRITLFVNDEGRVQRPYGDPRL